MSAAQKRALAKAVKASAAARARGGAKRIFGKGVRATAKVARPVGRTARAVVKTPEGLLATGLGSAAIVSRATRKKANSTSNTNVAVAKINRTASNITNYAAGGARLAVATTVGGISYATGNTSARQYAARIAKASATAGSNIAGNKLRANANVLRAASERRLQQSIDEVDSLFNKYVRGS